MLKYRFISAFLLVVTITIALFLLSLIGFATVILVVCMIAAWEWGQFSGFTSQIQRISLSIFCGLVLVLMLFFLPKYYYDSNHPLVVGSLLISLGWWISALLLVLFYPTSAIMWRDSRLLRLIFGIFTIIPFFWSMLILRAWQYKNDHYSGARWLLYIMILVWGTDSGAYIFGKLFGKHKLAPNVSPEKTWQGFIGGLFIAIIASWSYGVLVNLEIPSIILSICSIFSALASVLGDLTESMFKREIGVKDSSHLIPGHGGILDRIDSLTAAVPVFVCLLFLMSCYS